MAICRKSYLKNLNHERIPNIQESQLYRLKERQRRTQHPRVSKINNNHKRWAYKDLTKSQAFAGLRMLLLCKFKTYKKEKILKMHGKIERENKRAKVVRVP